jgi:hypothetical protein
MGGLKSMATQHELEYPTVLCTFSRSNNRSLFEFQDFCRAINSDGKTDMDFVVKILDMPEQKRREKLKALIYERFSSIQEMCRQTGVSDSYIEQLFRGETGARVKEFYRPLATALGLNLESIAAILKSHVNTRVS